MAQVFISYRREDGQEFSRRLRDNLGRLGQPAWLDEEIRPGQPWTNIIEEAIDRSDAVLAVLSASYHLSRVARMEIERAFGQKKPLIPLLIAAGATPPLLLQTLQYIDFTDATTYNTRLSELIDVIRNPPTGAPAAASTVGPGTQWNDALARANQQTRRFLSAHQGRPDRPGSFMPELYVRRESVERAFERFLTDGQLALVLVGEAGVGKTNVLCHLAQDLLAAGHAVFPYDCGALPDADIEREIARDLSLGSPDRLPEELARIERAPSADRKVIVVFDSINEYTGDGQNGTEALLRRINALVVRLDAQRVRVVLSCSTATWKHMERQGPLRLDWSRYFHSDDEEPVVRMKAFTPEEFDRAYPLYQNSFSLSSPLEALSPELRERLRDPVLLRMTAEAYRGVQQPLVPQNLALGIYRRFFDERVRQPRESWLVDELAAEMLKRGTGAIAITELARHERLGPEILSEDLGSTFARLLDRGVLQEWQADLRAGTVIKFSHTGVAAYAIALHLLQHQGDSAAVTALVARAGQFPLAWEVALAFLLVSKDDATVTTLAESGDLEQRELACEALVQWHAEDPAKAAGLLRRLLEGTSERARRTALKAAYSIGPQARDIFLRAAIDGEPSLRESVKSTLYLIWRNESPAGRRKAADTLYVIWRHAPGFTYDVLNELLGQITLKNIGKLPSILEFVIDLSITIYINHCDNEEVIQKTADLYHDLATRRLYLNLLNTGIFGPAFEGLVFRAVARAFSHRILDWMLFAEVVPIQGFFDLPTERRHSLAIVADALDPQSRLEAVEDDLAAMLQSGLPTLSSAAALAIAVHACRDFRRTEPVVRRLFDRIGQPGRLWLVVGFSVLLQKTPAEWVTCLEYLTRRYLDDHREAFLTSSDKFLGNLDIALLPLGLAYGKQGSSMPLFETLIQDGLAAGDMRLVARCVSALGPVGFYYPEPMLEVLRPVADHLGDEQIQKALLTCLATVKTLHFDVVDLFLHRLGVPDSFSRRVDAASDEALVRRYIHVVGHYNNAVHYTVHYPRMRRQLAMGALQLLARARDPQQFVADYTAVAIRMFREADFQLREWTRPD